MTVSQVTNSDGTLTIAPTTGNVVASLSQAGLQTYLPGGFVNKLRNPNFAVCQRGTSGSVIATTQGTPAYTLDGWIVYAECSTGGPTVAWAQDLTPVFYGTYNMSITGNTNVTDVQLQTRIESEIMGELFWDGDTPLTFQIGIYNVTGGTLTPTLIVSYFNSVNNSSTLTQDISESLQSVGNGDSATLAYTWIPGSADYKNGIQVAVDFGGSLGSTSQYIYVFNADLRSTPGVSTGLNSNPPIPEFRPTAIELVFCQRYFVTSYGNGVAPGTATRVGMQSIGSTTVQNVWVGSSMNFPVQMLAAPMSIPYYDGAGNSSKLTYLSDTTFTDNATPGDHHIGFNVGTTGIINTVINTPGGNAIWFFHYTASAEL